MAVDPLMPPQVVHSNPLRISSDYGVHNGSNMDVAPHLIPTGYGRYLQDVLLDNPGLTRQRGGVDQSSHDGAFPDVPEGSRGIGLTSLLDPNGTSAYRILLLTASYSSGDLEAYVYGRAAPSAASPMSGRDFFELDAGYGHDQMDEQNLFIDGRELTFSLVGDLVGTVTVASGPFGASSHEPFFQAMPCLDGGVLIGVGLSYGPESAAANRYFLHWRGAGLPDYSAGTVDVAQDSTAVVGNTTDWDPNVEPGMFLLDEDDRYIGTIASVQSDGGLTLEHNALHKTASAITYRITSLRPMFATAPLVSVGVISTATDSAVVNGGLTKFADQKLVSGDPIFRASDYTYIGTVTSVASNVQLTLTGNAAQALENEPYIAIPYDSSALGWAAGKMPVFSSYWNGIQFAGNADNRRQGLNERSRIFILGPDILDACDLTQTGSFYDIPSTKPHTDIRTLFPTESGLLCMLAEETYGLFGNLADQLIPKLLLNDGTLAPMTVQPYKGGAIWTGHQGVFYYDGASTHNLLANRAAGAHGEAISDIDYNTRRAWAMLHRSHYVVFLEKINSWVYVNDQGRALSDQDGGSEVQDEHIIYSINLDSEALVFWTNVNVRGYTHPPGRLDQENDGYYLLERSDTTGPAICSAESLFSDNYHATPAEDEFLSNPVVARGFAPQFYIETKLYDFGDPQLLKLIKQLQVQYTTSKKLGVDVITGLTRDTKALSPFRASTAQLSNPAFWNKRVKFLKRSTHAGFRLYTMIDQVPSIVQVGTWAIGTKPQRPGRV